MNLFVRIQMSDRSLTTNFLNSVISIWLIETHLMKKVMIINIITQVHKSLLHITTCSPINALNVCNMNRRKFFLFAMHFVRFCFVCIKKTYLLNNLDCAKTILNKFLKCSIPMSMYIYRSITNLKFVVVFVLFYTNYA